MYIVIYTLHVSSWWNHSITERVFIFVFIHVVVPHNCDFACWKKGVELQDFYNYNPLEVPLRLGWQRYVGLGHDL